MTNIEPFTPVILIIEQKFKALRKAEKKIYQVSEYALKLAKKKELNGIL